MLDLVADSDPDGFIHSRVHFFLLSTIRGQEINGQLFRTYRASDPVVWPTAVMSYGQDKQTFIIDRID